MPDAAMGPPAVENIKYLFFEPPDENGADTVYRPCFYVDARVGFNDIRTGFRADMELSNAVEIHPLGPDYCVVPDMVKDINRGNLKSTPHHSAHFQKLPGFVGAEFMAQMESHFIGYLLKYCKAKVYRNFALNVYSYAGESLQDFTARCMDMLAVARQEELDSLHEVFNRRLGQIEKKYLKDGSAESFELIKADSLSRDIFSSCLERVSEFFLQCGSGLMAYERRNIRRTPVNTELAERLEALESEVQEAVSRLWECYRDKASSVDEYFLHPNLKDIHIARSCILWMPVGID